MNTEPDGMVGAAVASESLGMTDTLINGAGGCRSRTQIMIHDLIPFYKPENGSCCKSKFFSRQSRLPCTYLNGNDLIFGTAQKLSEGLKSVSSVNGRKTMLIDTLGASLVCTDYTWLTEKNREPVRVNGDLSAMSFCEGFDAAAEAILSSMEPERGEKTGVNILGYGISDLGWNYGCNEIRRLLEPMGVRIGCFPNCIPDPDSLKRIGNSSLNIMIHPELCTRTAEMLEEKTGTPYMRPSMGAPVGYPSIRKFIEETADHLGKDPEPSLEIVNREAEEVHSVLMNYDRIPLFLHARPFTAKGSSSVIYPLSRWIAGAFGMLPGSISLSDGEYRKEIDEYMKPLKSAGTGEDGFGVVFTDGLSAMHGRLYDLEKCYVETEIPPGRQVNLLGRTLVGTAGCRYILDEMMNGTIRFRCGQPTEIDLRPGYEETG
ncbi:MAG: hypothetical protein J5494_01795 [Candidatus Methanomethylophilaceae archaeon]|nr:hypothetical protein [Candidatus Methanomethylophilaceae archaeon]